MDVDGTSSGGPVAGQGQPTGEQGVPWRLLGGITLAVLGHGLAMFGFRTGVDAIQHFHDHPPPARDVGDFVAIFLLCAFAAAQFGAGAGLIMGGVRTAREAWRRRRHPSEPWLWRRDWAAGVIKYSRGRTVPVWWGAAAVWNAVLWLSLMPQVPVQEWIEREATGGLACVALFAIFGVVLVLGAALATVRWWRFRESVFEMVAVPGRIGGQLDGTVRARVTLAADQTFHVRLACEQSPGLGGTRDLLWQPEYTVAGDGVAISALYSAIPVRFEIPASCRPSTSTLRNPFVWRLLVAAGGGSAYRAEFEVPVFSTIGGNASAVAAEDDIAVPDESTERDAD